MYKEFFSGKPTAEKWDRIDYKKRAGVCLPLFSIYSNKSMGIGEIPDIKHVVDWCIKTGFSIIQLLPINDTGGNISPYSSVSSFAIDPIYLSLTVLIKQYKLKHLEVLYKEILDNTRGLQFVDYSVRKTKLEFLRLIYEEVKHIDLQDFNEYKETNNYWLTDYCLYVLFKNLYDKSWQNWDSKVRDKNNELCNDILVQYSCEIEFQSWVQFILFKQLKDVKSYAADNSILIMGDIPFLVSRDSADTWAHYDYFNFDLEAGAPPDMYFYSGQKWGMPPYNWQRIQDDDFVYLQQRLKYAENFYDMYRIDHFIGLFRLWVTDVNEDKSSGALNGRFEPENENVWSKHGEVIIQKMLEFTTMMPCAEDLGTVPRCSYEALDNFGIIGMDFQRYNKTENNFVEPKDYRINSCSVISTHDSTHFCYWWDNEAGTIDEKLFDRLYLKYGSTDELAEVKERLFDKELSDNKRLFWKEEWIDSEDKLLWELRLNRNEAWEFIELYKYSYKEKNKYLDFLGIDNSPHSKSDPELFEAAFLKTLEARSIFSIQLITDLLLLDKRLHKKINCSDYRINTPGVVNDLNWRVRLPVSLTQLKKNKFNEKIKQMLVKNERC
jgi:4-alpha-glucanotransferase